MNVHYSKKLSHAFVANSDNLEKLVKLLQNRVGEVNISTDCADGFSRDFNTIEDLIDYENPYSKEIRRIDLSARSDGYKKSADIDFAGGISQRGILIRFKGGEEVVLGLRDKTQDIIAGMRPWYSWISRINSDYTMGIIVWLLYLTVRLARSWLSISDYEVELGYVIMIPLLFIILLIALFFGKRLFPPAAFAIGQGNGRYKLKEQIRWCVVVAFLVSVAAGVLPLIWQVITG